MDSVSAKSNWISFLVKMTPPCITKQIVDMNKTIISFVWTVGKRSGLHLRIAKAQVKIIQAIKICNKSFGTNPRRFQPKNLLSRRARDTITYEGYTTTDTPREATKPELLETSRNCVQHCSIRKKKLVFQKNFLCGNCLSLFLVQ